MTSYIIAQLLNNLPTLLVLLTGGIVAITFIQRAQTAAFLTLGGVALMLIAILVQIGVGLIVIQMRSRGQDPQLWSNISQGSGALMGLMRAASLGLILAGVFVGRNPPPGQLK